MVVDLFKCLNRLELGNFPLNLRQPFSEFNDKKFRIKLLGEKYDKLGEVIVACKVFEAATTADKRLLERKQEK